VDAGSPEVPAAIDGDVRELQRAILASRGAVDVVASLTTEVGPRLAGSPGDKLAVKWALHTMEARGFTNVHAEPAKVRAWQRGVETAAIVAPVKQPMAVTALGWSGATPAKGIEADVARFDSLEALKNADPKGVAGKIAFVDVKMERTATFKGYGDAVSARGDGPKVAATKGALAFLVRSIGTDQTRFPHAGASRQIDQKTPLPAGAISNADADLLDRVLAAHGSARLALNLGPKRLAPADSANVVGEIPGSSAPDEVVLLGAHLDSWDLGQGAIDDGAGCGIVLEAAHAIGALAKKSRRTVRVVLFASEEYSGDGSKEYARAHASDAAKIVVALEADEGTDRVLTAKYLGDPARRARRHDRRQGGPRRQRHRPTPSDRRPHRRPQPGRDALLRHAPHRERHVRTNRPGRDPASVRRFRDRRLDLREHERRLRARPGKRAKREVVAPPFGVR
jgi:hypothetical protein